MQLHIHNTNMTCFTQFGTICTNRATHHIYTSSNLIIKVLSNRIVDFKKVLTERYVGPYQAAMIGLFIKGISYGSRYSRMDPVKFVKDSL